MKGLVGCLAVLVTASTVGCYSHTKEVVVERTTTAPSGCKHAVWVPPAPGVGGYWRCTM